MKNELLTTIELAEVLNVSRQTIFNWRKEGMPFYKINKAVRFDLVEIKEWLQTKKG